MSNHDIHEFGLREVACRLRQRLGQEAGVVLAGPEDTTSLVFYGGFRGIGTLYWENVDGLKTAAAIYGAPSAQDALQLIQEGAITHIVLFSFSHYADQYVRLHRGLDIHQELPADAFIPSLLRAQGQEQAPSWLRPLFVPLPFPLNTFRGYDVAVFEVVPKQSKEEAILRWARVQFFRGRTADAQAFTRSLLATCPNYLPALIFQAQMEDLLRNKSALQDVLPRVVKNLDQANKLALEDRLVLALVFKIAGNNLEFKENMQACLRLADEKSLRRLEPLLLDELLSNTQLLGLAGVRPDIVELVRTLLPTSRRD